MNGGVSKAQTRQFHRKLSNASEGKLADAVARKRAGMYGGNAPRLRKVERRVNSSGTGQSSREESRVKGDVARDTPVHTKRGRDASSGVDRLPTKKAQWTRTDTQRPGAEDKKAEQAAKTTLRQPKSSPDPKVEGPRQVSPATRLRLTQKNLALFNKMARKKETNKESASGAPESTVESSTTKTTSTTTSGFALQADQNGTLDPFSSKPPKNLEDIHTRHGRSRETASPPESVHKDYLDTVGTAVNEATMVCDMLPLLKTYPNEGYKKAFNQAFTGFPEDVGFNNGLSAPQPGFVEGLRRREFLPFPIDKHVSGAVLYKDDPHSLTLPQLAGEWKGRGKNMEEARLQSAYNGAALVYARNQALSSIGKPDSPGHAEVTTFTTDGTSLNFLAHYATPSEDGTLEYHQYPYASTTLKKYQGFKDGRRGLRNEQDHARKQSYTLRDQLKEHWKRRRDALQPVAEGAPLPVPGGELPGTMNAYEDEAGYEMVEQLEPCEPTPPTSSKPERLSKHDETSSSHSPSSKPPPPAGGARKRKASLSEESSHSSSRPKSK
ncbi:hypothetical protein B0T19DRAFT_290949 [Cercophora scortea]|uniref:Uncharacterized protein n=1 Tax=Cercophora scortea TaxID=314031 RepID=A0AAE0M3J5_9PEZI|nr:hypothetical protein B0T19DRAFT_290949 [Cercophora scortea]